jgi:hypothetical protein
MIRFGKVLFAYGGKTGDDTKLDLDDLYQMLPSKPNPPI